MKFVATLFVVLAIVTGANALHPPVEQNPQTQQNQSSSSGSTTTTTVSITSVDTAPEPSAVVLALLGMAGTYHFRRRSR
jgi:hypothetical protein